nr:aromatic acid exporter family protein [Escherichia coli]
EPTAADSIKKAFIRFPASAIGAAFAMLYTFLLGVTPLTYMLVAVSTIISCSKLRLHAGTLVATLTGVAMLTIVHDH